MMSFWGNKLKFYVSNYFIFFYKYIISLDCEGVSYYNMSGKFGK